MRRIVEIAGRDDVIAPLGPYTEALMAAVPVADPEARRGPRGDLGRSAERIAPAVGRSFHTRCPRGIAVCKTEQPLLRKIDPGRAVRAMPRHFENPTR